MEMAKFIRIVSIFVFFLQLGFPIGRPVIAGDSSPKHFVFDLTGSIHGYGDITGPLWTLIDLKKQYESSGRPTRFSVILDSRAEAVIKEMYRSSSVSGLAKDLNIDFVKSNQFPSLPKADYLFQLFYGGRKIEDLSTHPLASSRTAVIISDTMHGGKLDEVRLGDRHLYFKPPGIGEQRSGIVANPDLRLFQNKSKEARKKTLASILRKEPAVVPLSPLFEEKGRRYPNAKYSFMYGAHNELQAPHLHGQSKEYIESLSRANAGRSPVIIFSPNSESDLRKVQVTPEATLLCMDDLKKGVPLENKVYIVPTGKLSNKAFTGLMSVADFPILIEGNSSVSTALSLKVPFALYRSPWNAPQLNDIARLEKATSGYCAYQAAYGGSDLVPGALGNLMNTLTRALDDEQGNPDSGKSHGEVLIQAMSQRIPELSRKLASVVDTVDKLETNRSSAQSHQERSAELSKLTETLLKSSHDEALAYSILSDAHKNGEIDESTFREQSKKLQERGISLSDLESRFVPNQPNGTLKLMHLAEHVDKEEQETLGIIKELQVKPVRDLAAHPETKEFIQKHNTYISMTTSPDRITHLHHVLDTLDLSHVKEVLINLPRRFGRNGAEYEIPRELYDPKYKVRFLRIPEDYGPITKLLPAIGYTRKRDPDSLVITVDDDQGYPKGMVNEMIYQSVRNQGQVVSGSGYEFPERLRADHLPFPRVNHSKSHSGGGTDVEFIEGYGSIGYRAGSVDLNFMAALSNISPECFQSDDLVISLALAIDNVGKRKVGSDFYNLSMRKDFPYGKKGDAIHISGGGLDPKYRKCFSDLMRVGYDSDTKNFRTKEDILKKTKELFGSGVNANIRWRSGDSELESQIEPTE